MRVNDYREKINSLLHSEQRWKLFLALFLGVIILGTFFSVLARLVILQDDEASRPRLAVVAPLQTPEGQSLLRGATLFVEQVNQEGGHLGRPMSLVAIEENESAAEQVAKEPNVVGVVGHLSAELLPKAAARYQAANLRLVTTLPVQGLKGVYSIGINADDEARFVANYARNILQKRLMYIVRQDSPAYHPFVDPVVELYKKFDTPVRAIWSLSQEPTDQDIQALLAKIRDIDIGSIYIATNPQTAARLVREIRAAGSMLDIVGPSFFAGNSFVQSLAAGSKADAEIHAHGIFTVTPVLFDTANERAQRFQSSYQRQFGGSPDWLATIAFDAAMYAIADGSVEDAKPGVLGQLAFSDQQAKLPIQVGIYNGTRLISAPIQLLSMSRGAGFNYIEALRQGRVLYVNDRFMYRSNVVYTGVTVHEVSEIDLEAETAKLDMSIWFRFRGKFEPQDLEILNAKEPVVFGEPEEVSTDQDFQYRRYRIKQVFQLNFSQTDRAYGLHKAGISFRHKNLNNNNLSYVVDVLGMPAGKQLFDDLVSRNVMAAGSSLRIDNAWVAQDVVRERGDGAPQYVGMTGEQPMFSVITLSLLLAPESLSARDFLSSEHLIYLGIFGLVGAVAAAVMDWKRRRQTLQLQTWLLRLIFWPCLLLSVGNFAIDFSFNNLASSTNRLVVDIYDSIWWIMAARLSDMALRRFLWIPLELRSGRMIPNVVKFMSSLVIYAFGFAGITALVLNEPLTSLLATSGLLAMVIGLAIQANIANVFSGIVLNVERPFKVGDYIQVNDIVGRVTDITWRTTRIESNDGPAISLANALISEAQMSNLSQLPHGYIAETDLHAPIDSDPELVLNILKEAVAQSDVVILKDNPTYSPRIRYLGVLSVDGVWVARFNARYRVQSLPKRDAASDQIWRYIALKFKEKGIPLQPATEE